MVHFGSPVLCGSLINLRVLRPSDAAPLAQALTTPLQPTNAPCVSFAVVPRGSDSPIGLFRVRSLESEFETAEWDFAIAPEFWGTGVFADGAALLLQFAFETLGTRRLEARADVNNERGNGALEKIGAVREGVVRSASGDDQAVWAIHARRRRNASPACMSAAVH